MDYPETVEELLDRLGNPELLSPDHYHNAAVGAHQLYDSACALAIAEAGLARFPRSSDLLADALLWSPFEMGALEQGTQDGSSSADESHLGAGEAEEYYKRLCDLGPYRNWRGYDFAIDYLIDKRSCGEDAAAARATLEEANDLAEAFIEAFPNDERAYSAKIKCLLALGMVDASYQEKAEELLEEKVFDGGIDMLPVSQCCVTYADLLLDRGDYRQAQRVAAIGLKCSAQAQPSAAIDYFVYVIALCKDALLIDAFVRGGVGREETAGELRNDLAAVMKIYERAYGMTDRDSFKGTILLRVSALCALFGVDLPEFAAEVEREKKEREKKAREGNALHALMGMGDLGDVR